MKKKLLLIILLLTGMLTGCGAWYQTDVNYSLDVSEIEEGVDIADFKLSMIKIAVTRDGETRYVPLDETMLSSKDLSELKSAGCKTITIHYEDFTCSATINLTEKPKLYEPYYSKAEGKRGNELKLALREIIKVVKKEETYDDLRRDLAKTDASSDGEGQIVLFYTGNTVPAEWDYGKTWNREHVWPKSLGWFNKTGAGADLHHIRPCDPTENSRRGNTRFGASDGFYEPQDNMKGDVARIVFYLLTRYDEADRYSAKDVAESEEMLLEWNKVDPVDEFEKRRNEAIYEIQGNRNPFIDHPEFADMIWMGEEDVLCGQWQFDFNLFAKVRYLRRNYGSIVFCA